MPTFSPDRLEVFRTTVRAQGRELYRDLPWRRTRDPYLVLVSECMLQQTQVSRVMGYWDVWLSRFPTADALAAAPLETVLESWRGLGYNRRAVALHRTAQEVSEHLGGVVPADRAALLSLPGVGPSTAAGVRVFAYDLPDRYLETNVRTVFLHELLPLEVEVTDRELIPLVEAACPSDDVRGWYYALLDYGAFLKRTLPNPSRRSAHHTRQSTFEGSRRQKRAYLLRAVQDEGRADLAHLSQSLDEAERQAGRPRVPVALAESILADLLGEGFLEQDTEKFWSIKGSDPAGTSEV